MSSGGFGGDDDPFGALGLLARADLTDDDVRAAWRRIAAATHPDREDGGDPVRFGAAAGAYALLRTAYSRGEVLADLGLGPGAPAWARKRFAVPWRLPRPRAGVSAGARVGVGVGRLALRAAVAGAVGGGAFAAAGWAPGSIGVATGALTWLAVTARHDIPARHIGGRDR